MKKILSIIIVCIIALSGCSSSEPTSAELIDTQEELSDLQEEYAKIKSSYDTISKEYYKYRETMKEYEELASSEAEARLIEATNIIEQEKAEKEEEERLAKEEADKKEKAGYETGITYEQLARTPDDYKGERIKFTGTVVQLLEGDSENNIRFAVDDDYDKLILCVYDNSLTTERILEDDTITIYGLSAGIYTYDSIFGQSISIPSVFIDKIDTSSSGTSSTSTPEDLETYIEVVEEYTWSSGNYEYVGLVIKNNSSLTLEITAKIKFTDKDDLPIGVGEDSVYAFGSGNEILLILSNDEDYEKYEYSFDVKEDEYYKEAVSMLDVKVNTTDSKCIIEVTNNGAVAAQFVSYNVLYFNKDKVVDYGQGYCNDDDFEIKPGKSEYTEDNTYGTKFDKVKVYITARSK